MSRENECPIEFVEWLKKEMPEGTVIGDPVWWSKRLYRAMLAATPQPPRVEVHPDDEAVDRMAARMKEKLATARLKGRSGWMLKDEWPEAEVNISLYTHLAKGDPVDVANYCMFLAERSERTYGITGQSEPEIQERIKRAREEERERCAKICERQYFHTVFHTDTLAAKNCAQAIRELKG